MEVPARPIFIVGSPRSGTSILTWSLGQHPNILPLEETNWIAKLSAALGPIYALGTARGMRSQLSADNISNAQFYECFGTAIDKLIRHNEERSHRDSPNSEFQRRRSPLDPKRRWADGTPENSFYIAALLRLFPAAKFIHILRDVQSVVRSLMNFANLGVPNFSEQAAYQQWTKNVRACIEAEEALGGDKVYRIEYSDLVHSPEGVLRRCLDFLEEPFCSDCLTPLKRKINSSKVPPDFNSYEASTDPRVREEAERLSQELLQGVWADQEYNNLVHKIRQLACSALPRNATVVVAGKGDDRLLKLEGLKGWHFPQDENGDYAGEHPADSSEAIAQLEVLRAKGGEYLLFPRTTFWWLEFYNDFRLHLDTRYRRVHQDEHCIIFQLSQTDPEFAEAGCRNPS